jgi:Protein of unknown function (DUF3309)
MLLGVIPAWPHSRNWGYAPSGTLGLIVLILLVLIVTGRGQATSEAAPQTVE